MLFKPVKKWPWTFEAVPVWPDARLKSSSIFTKVSQKKPKLFLHLKRGFRKAHKVAQCLGYICKRICLQDFSKVAQSDYTVQFVPNGDQCDQIGQFITIWATFQSSWQQLFCHKSPTFLGNFCNGVKIFNFTSKILFWQLLWTLGDFLLVTLMVIKHCRRWVAIRKWKVILHHYHILALMDDNSFQRLSLEIGLTMHLWTTLMYLHTIRHQS